MRTYFSLFLGLCLAIVSFSSCKKSSDNNNDPGPVSPPATIIANSITMNNVNISAVPSGSVYLVYVELYSGNVLLAKSYGVDIKALPNTTTFEGTNTFAYASFKTYDLKYYSVDINGQSHYLGTVPLALKDYSSETYPKPSSMFYNTNGFAGTLEFGYN